MRVMRASSGVRCLRCEKHADEYRAVWFLSGQKDGFCEGCVFELIKLMLVVEKVDKGEID